MCPGQSVEVQETPYTHTASITFEARAGPSDDVQLLSALPGRVPYQILRDDCRHSFPGLVLNFWYATSPGPKVQTLYSSRLRLR
jgi:hypothetical protein